MTSSASSRNNPDVAHNDATLAGPTSCQATNVEYMDFVYDRYQVQEALLPEIDLASALP